MEATNYTTWLEAFFVSLQQTMAAESVAVMKSGIIIYEGNSGITLLTVFVLCSILFQSIPELKLQNGGCLTIILGFLTDVLLGY